MPAPPRRAACNVPSHLIVQDTGIALGRLSRQEAMDQMLSNRRSFLVVGLTKQVKEPILTTTRCNQWRLDCLSLFSAYSGTILKRLMYYARIVAHSCSHSAHSDHEAFNRLGMLDSYHVSRSVGPTKRRDCCSGYFGIARLRICINCRLPAS